MPRASRRRGEAAHRHADTLRFVLFEARPAGLLFPQLTRASELSPSQVRSGLAALRDTIAENGWPPLIWTRADGYQLGAERAALEAYERAVLTEKLTEFRRFITGT
ncbi:RacP protein, partial [Streptomyces sp. SID2955]|nr:RacP protein [Streptomyces sp. SID2955]